MVGKPLQNFETGIRSVEVGVEVALLEPRREEDWLEVEKLLPLLLTVLVRVILATTGFGRGQGVRTA